MRAVRVFISYARVDVEQAMYVRSLLDGAPASAAPVGLIERIGWAQAAVRGMIARGVDQENGAQAANSAAMAPGVDVTLRVWLEEESRSEDGGAGARRAIESSGCFVVLAPSRASTFVAKECAIALAAGVPIVPITRSPADLNGYHLSGYQALKWPRSDARSSAGWNRRWSEEMLRAVRESVAGQS